MKIKNENFKKGIKNLTEGSKEVVRKTKNVVIKSIDQNDDKTLNKEDLKAIKTKINSTAQKTTSNIRRVVDEKRKENDLKKLQPIFLEDLESAEFVMPKLICVSNMDKRYLESDVCQGAIGYRTNFKDLLIITIFKEKINNFNLDFYPDMDSEVYYIDPTDKDKYIALEDYFDYLKEVRVNELEKIAQDLGAKHFKVTLMEEKKTFSKREKTMKDEGQYLGKSNSLSVGIEHTNEALKGTALEISAESYFDGHEPLMPTVCYLSKESNIQTLISLRMDRTSPLKHRQFSIKLSKTSGIREKDAEKIDGALKMMKISGNTTVVNEVSEESRRYFEYEIEF